MFTRRPAARIALAFLAALLPSLVLAAAPASSQDALTAKATALVQNMAKGDFTAAEADFGERMKQVTPAQLKSVWDGVVKKSGAFQKIGTTRTTHALRRFHTVIVNTEFKTEIVGFAVTFNDDGRVAGLHLVQAAPAQ